jgi:hypothetical protein
MTKRKKQQEDIQRQNEEIHETVARAAKECGERSLSELEERLRQRGTYQPPQDPKPGQEKKVVVMLVQQLTKAIVDLCRPGDSRLLYASILTCFNELEELQS